MTDLLVPPADLLIPPQYLWLPERDGSSGTDAVEFAASVGWIADPEQELMIDAMLGERDGLWAAFETAVIEPRQNGKTDAGQAASLYDLFIRRVSRIVWSAHKYKTCADTFTWFAGVCENYDHLRKRVYQVYSGTGEQSIKLLPRHTGPVMDFVARSTGSGRGLDGDITNLDEALYLNPMMMGALVPIMSAKPNPQLRYFSSAGVLSSSVLRGVRDRGRPGGDPSLAYVEFGCPQPAEDDPTAPRCEDPNCTHLNGSAGCLTDDIPYLRLGNPAKRITDKYLQDERRSFGSTPDLVTELLRERMGWWEDPPEGTQDPVLAAWPACAAPTATLSDPVHLGIDVSPNMASGAIVAAGWDNGRTVVEVVEHRRGTAWIPDRLAELIATHKPASVGLVAGSPAAALMPDLPDTVTELKAAETTAACATFARAVTDEQVAHLDQAPLNDAVAAGRRKFSGDGWRWSRRDSDGDIAPLYAATVARHLLTCQPPPVDPVVLIF